MINLTIVDSSLKFFHRLSIEGFYTFLDEKYFFKYSQEGFLRKRCLLKINEKTALSFDKVSELYDNQSFLSFSFEKHFLKMLTMNIEGARGFKITSIKVGKPNTSGVSDVVFYSNKKGIYSIKMGRNRLYDCYEKLSLNQQELQPLQEASQLDFFPFFLFYMCRTTSFSSEDVVSDA